MVHRALALLVGLALVVAGCSDPAEDTPTDGDRIVLSPPEPGEGHSHPDGQGPGGAVGDGQAAQAGGYALTDVRVALSAGLGDLSFRIEDADGSPVTEYVEEQTRPLHLYVVREDLGAFRHLHPTLERDGTWSSRVDLGSAGRHRLIAEFTPAGGPHVVLGAEATIRGDDLPPRTPAEDVGATNDNGVVRVSVAEPLGVGPDGRMEITVGDPEGREVALGSYLGAAAHVTGFETTTGDFVHVHPYGSPESVAGGTLLTFHTGFTEPGTYRFFVQVRVDGFVHTVPVTARVE